MVDAKPICIHCGNSTEQEGRLNRLADGRVCPSCRDRLLDSLPPLLPSFDYGQESEPIEHLAADGEGGETGNEPPTS